MQGCCGAFGVLLFKFREPEPTECEKLQQWPTTLLFAEFIWQTGFQELLFCVFGMATIRVKNKSFGAHAYILAKHPGGGQYVSAAGSLRATS